MNVSAAAAVDSAADAAPGAEAALGLVFALTILTVILRIYVRVFTGAGVGWDDYLIVVSALALIASGALSVSANIVDPNGAADSVNTDPGFVFSPADELYNKLEYGSAICYFVMAGSTKLGIILMYDRLFAADPIFRRELALAFFLVFAWIVGCIVASLTDCIPMYWNWVSSSNNPQYCFNFNIFWMASGACEVFLDVMILSLPVRRVIKLRMSTRRKITVAGIFLLGGFVVITGLVRTILGYVPGQRNPNFDLTVIWTSVHAGMATICASLPIFRPLAKKMGRCVGITRLHNRRRKPDSLSTSNVDESQIQESRLEEGGEDPSRRGRPARGRQFRNWRRNEGQKALPAEKGEKAITAETEQRAEV